MTTSISSVCAFVKLFPHQYTRPRMDAACYPRKAAVTGEDMLDFLKGIVESVPDLGNEDEAPSPDTKPKRRR